MRTPVGRMVVVAVLATASGGDAGQVMSARDLLALPQPPPDETFVYGPSPQQFAEMSLPPGPGPHPVVVVIHGGCWQTPWGLDHVRSLCAALVSEGMATWSLEYRRLGDPGGGWPGTFEDVARGADALRDLARDRRVDLDRVVALGHSAGGHLALWLAGRHRLPDDDALRGEAPLALRGVLSLAGVPDLREGARREVCGDAIPRLLGGAPDEDLHRLRLASPMELLPLGVPQHLLHGSLDGIVPPNLSGAYALAARQAGDTVRVEIVDGAGHFELVRPGSVTWPAVLASLRALIPSRTDRAPED